MNDFQKFLDDNLKKVDLKEVQEEKLKTAKDIYKDISKLIIDIRIQSGFTQKELAEKSGLTQSNISNIEKGISKPTIETLKKIADATGKKLIIEFIDEEVIL